MKLIKKWFSSFISSNYLQFKWFIGGVTAIVLVSIIIFLYKSGITPFSVNREPSCDQKLTYSSYQAKKIEQVCKKIAEKDPKNLKAWKNAGRASLVAWDFSKKHSELVKAEKYLAKAKKYFNEANKNDPNRYKDNADPQIAFYRDFMKDFEAIVINETVICQKTENRYSRALYLYEKQEDFKEGDFFILNELAHFLTNRDKNYLKAIELLEKIPNKEEGYNQHVLLSKIIAHALYAQEMSDKNPDEAKKHLEKAKNLLKVSIDNVENYKFKYYLATTYVQIASQEKELKNQINNYERARELYEQVINKDVAENFYRAQRNYSLTLYLLGLYKEKQGDREGAIQSYIKANEHINKIFKYDFLTDNNEEVNRIDTEENVNLILNKYRNILKECSRTSNCITQNLDSIEREVINIITSNSYYIPHQGSIDAFFDIEHDKFYCQNVNNY